MNRSFSRFSVRKIIQNIDAGYVSKFKGFNGIIRKSQFVMNNISIKILNAKQGKLKTS